MSRSVTYFRLAYISYCITGGQSDAMHYEKVDCRSIFETHIGSGKQASAGVHTMFVELELSESLPPHDVMVKSPGWDLYNCLITSPILSLHPSLPFPL